MPEWRITRLRGELCVTWDDPNIAGGRRRYQLGTNDLKEANRRAPAKYAEYTRPVGKQVEELWNAYCREMAGRAVVGTMQHTWKAMKDRFGAMEADAISVLDCRAHVAERRRGKRNKDGKLVPISDGTIHTELGHLRMVLKWAEKNQFIERAPAIERPTKPDPKESYLTRAEVRSLIDATRFDHIKTAIELLIGTAARIEAALQLEWDRVDFGRKIINLRNPFDRAKRKGRAVVPMNETLAARLKAAHDVAMTQFVVEWAGMPVKSIKRGLKAAGEKIGRPDISPHMLRHSAAVWLAEDGHSMESISQFLGHNDAKITARVYARFSPTHLRKLADSLNT